MNANINVWYKYHILYLVIIIIAILYLLLIKNNDKYDIWWQDHVSKKNCT